MLSICTPMSSTKDVVQRRLLFATLYFHDITTVYLDTYVKLEHKRCSPTSPLFIICLHYISATTTLHTFKSYNSYNVYWQNWLISWTGELCRDKQSRELGVNCADEQQRSKLKGRNKHVCAHINHFFNPFHLPTQSMLDGHGNGCKLFWLLFFNLTSYYSILTLYYITTYPHLKIKLKNDSLYIGM